MKFYLLTMHCLFALTGTFVDAIGPIEVSKEFILEKHNEYRKAAGASNMRIMTWDDTLATFAQSVVDTCIFAHSSGGGYGENLWAGTGNSIDGVTTSWHNEISDFDLSSNTCSTVCGHYTQVVWWSTYKLGCAARRCPGTGNFLGGNDFTLVACNYSPPGNYVGERPFTEGKPCSACDTDDYCFDSFCANVAEDGKDFRVSETTAASTTTSTSESTTSHLSTSTSQSTTTTSAAIETSPSWSTTTQGNSPSSTSGGTSSSYTTTSISDGTSSPYTTSTSDPTPTMTTSTTDSPTNCPGSDGCGNPCVVTQEKYRESLREWKKAMEKWQKEMNKLCKSCNQ
uniref:GLIPR1-like protein 1 n=1 Tax=Styela clava TaxID=7725 RepID=UPI00193A3FA1|nr:GLIPR1-like protein 1 [Styela clava]